LTELPSTALALTSSQVLAWIASALLVFVSAGVIYLSVVDWRDRRRRRADEARSRNDQAGARKSAKGSENPSGPSSRPPTAFGRRP
jgi:uncharacterized membrane protein